MDRIPRVIRFPPKLNDRLIREAGERTMKTGKRVSANEVVVRVLEQFFRKEGSATR